MGFLISFKHYWKEEVRGEVKRKPKPKEINKKEIRHIEISLKNGNKQVFFSKPSKQTIIRYKEFVKIWRTKKYLVCPEVTFRCEDISSIGHYKGGEKEDE